MNRSYYLAVICSFSGCYTGCKFVNILFPLLPDDLGINDTTIYEVQRREKGSMEQRIQREKRRKSVEEEMRKINLVILGPRYIYYLSTYLSICLSIIHFLHVSLKMGETRRLFMALPLLPILWSLCHLECPICNL